MTQEIVLKWAMKEKLKEGRELEFEIKIRKENEIKDITQEKKKRVI